MPVANALEVAAIIAHSCMPRWLKRPSFPPRYSCSFSVLVPVRNGKVMKVLRLSESGWSRHGSLVCEG